MPNYKTIAISTVSIATVTVILILSYYVPKVNKLEESEMKWIELASECADTLQDAITKLEDKTFERNKECLAEGRILAKRWYNIGSGYYDKTSGECWVSYKDVDTKETKYSPMSDMEDV